MLKFKSVSLGVVGLLILSASSAYGARKTASGYLDTARPHTPWTFPGINVSSPAGYGAQWGNVGLGVGFQNRIRNATNADGSMGFAFGIGDGQEYVGLETAISILSMAGNDAFKRGSMSFKLHRQLGAGFGVAVGRESAVVWGGTDGGQSWYGSVSKIFSLGDPTEWFSAITLTAGVGDGRFRREADVTASRSTVNVFGSAAFRIQEPVAFIADWSGQDLSLGLSITPLRDFGLYLNPAIVDVTGSAGNGVRFIMGIGLGYTFI